MKRKGFWLVAIMSALMLASCSANGGKENESGVEPVAQESSAMDMQQSEAGSPAAQGSVEASSANESVVESSVVLEETPAPTERKGPSEKQLPGKPFADPTTDPTPIPNDTELHGYNRIELSGNRNDHVITDKFCYLRSDKYVMFFENDLDLPGDLKVNLDLIVDTIEDVVGLPYNAPEFNPILGNYTHFDKNPWENIELNKRVAIFFFVDREDVGYICSADAEMATIFMYELYTDEVWNSVPSYKDNAWRRQDYIDYYTFAHELTHVLTSRYATMTEIMTEGCADYVAEVVMERLKDTSEDFAKSYEQMKGNFAYRINKSLTKDNAEEIFIDDFSELAMVDREEKYILGRMICEYLSESYGEAFLRDYMDAVKNLADRFSYANMRQSQRENFAKKFKSLFGDDAFVNFAEWYQKNTR